MCEIRMPHETNKTGLFALGKIVNIESYIRLLQKLTTTKVNENDVNANVEKAYQEKRELCYCYDDSGNPQITQFDKNRTCTYAVETGYYSNDLRPQMIYAIFNKNQYGIWKGVRFTTKYHLSNKLNIYRFGKITFRNYKEADSFIQHLHEELLPGELWKFKHSVHNNYRIKTEFSILQSYLQFVFEKLLEEYNKSGSDNYKKIIFSSDNKFALFNTGLLSRFAKDIFIMGEVYNLDNDGSFCLSNPQIASSKVNLISAFGFKPQDLTPMPDMAKFFTNINQIVYDANVEIDLSAKALNHAIIDGIKRQRYLEKYQEMLNEGDEAHIATLLTNAIENAKKIAKRNYKYVVPQYRAATKTEAGKIQFLMPIYLDNQYNNQPDFALVLNDERLKNSRFYTPETVLELSWAYNNARVICKPDDTWLMPSKIEESSTDQTESELD